MRGFVALSTVLIISAVMLSVIGTMTYLAIGEAQSTFALSQGENNLALVEGCAEDVILKVRDNPSFSGTSITRPEGTCSLAYTSGGPSAWDVSVTTTATDFKRKVRVVFTRNSSAISLSSWQEI